ncbi:MAG: iron-sulfur cluster assembly scaffold protein [Verrucomicrobia bacterium]|nr:iron-sulfur cluster assembly scaffold protein [Verrucomicrobiota bacterium]
MRSCRVDSDLSARLEAARANPQNVGELPGADAVGTVGSADCGDLLRMWVKFETRPDGRRVIDKATFQSFGCQTAIAVASVATELIRGKTPDEALQLSHEDLSAPLGSLPPMKIHCAQLVEGALKQALAAGPADAVQPAAPAPTATPAKATTLYDQLMAGTATPAPGKKLNIVLRS